MIDMKNIVIIQPMGVAESELAELHKLGRVTYYDTVCKDGEDWLNRTKDADIVMSNVTGLKEAWPEAKDMFITLTFVGFGFMDIGTLRKNNVIVANSPGCNQIAVTEWLVAMLLNHVRYLPQSIKMVEADKKLPVGESLHGKPVCIIGKGNIGSRVGGVLEALGMKVNFYTRNDLDPKIKDADFIVDCLSLNQSTGSFYNNEFFAQAKDGVVFMSISPNETQDLDAIERLLASGKIKHFITDNASAQLYDIADETYKRLTANPNITITPHMAAYADNTAETANRMCVENIRAYLAGKPMNLIYG
jgi:phosphoglycerate dehydrogenase-like enzyme